MARDPFATKRFEKIIILTLIFLAGVGLLLLFIQAHEEANRLQAPLYTNGETR